MIDTEPAHRATETAPNLDDLAGAAVLESFDADGAVLIPALIDNETVERLRRAADRALLRSENYFRRLRVWEDDPDCADFCLRSRAPALAARLLRTSKINLFYDQVFTKEPNAPATPWHNDQPYWPVRGWPVMTVWLALDEVTGDAGPLEFIAGSHKWDRWFQPFVAADDGGVAGVYESSPDYEPLPDFDAQREQFRILCWTMQPGDALGFHAMIVHGARANSQPDKRRRGYAVRYAGKETTYYQGAAVNPRLCNSELRPGDPLDSRQYPVAYRG